MSKPRAKGLGRGLEALLGGRDAEPPAGEGGPQQVTALRLDALQPGRYQPRTRMDETSLHELAASIRAHGLMQPLVVRPLDGSGRWEIIAGERRYRAAQLAGLAEVPVVVREVPDEQALAMALIENIQREDLNPLEQAQAIRRLIAEFGFSHEQAADTLGRSRSATSNLLRLLNLAEPVQTMLLAGDLDMGHARALLALDRAGQIMLANRVVERRLSVRETEKLVQQAAAEAAGTPARRAAPAPDRDLLRLQERLADALATPVTLRADARGRGKLTIEFASLEQFDGLLDRLGVDRSD
ncbi:MAG: ParB/RepB/Spo0J family partition protein [Burkholderiales bacterium]|nr:ParB/RepB/Spo0J family partition protein [Burkholderiales bacterium]OJX04065.1 MAG: chromosome partitioning protein ParB [Burkholderiales bacterium 70-64]